jgi:hypothetical protein
MDQALMRGNQRDQAMKAPTCQIDFLVLVHGTIGLVRPLTRGASEWINKHVPSQSQWFGPALLLEHRYIAELLDRMVEDGLRVRKQIVKDVTNSVSRRSE